METSENAPKVANAAADVAAVSFAVPPPAWPYADSPCARFAQLERGRTCFRLYEPIAAAAESCTFAHKNVVCFHGMAWWSFVWHRAASMLRERGCRVLTFDFYGRGQSEAPAADYNLQMYVDQAEQLVNAVFGDNATFVVLGLSMGGAVLSAFAAQHARRMHAAIFVSPAGTPVAMPFMARVVRLPYLGWPLFWLVGQQQLLARLHSQGFKSEFFDETGVSKAELGALIDLTEWQILHKPGFLESFHAVLANFPMEDTTACYAAIPASLPVLLIWGNDDALIPCKNSAVIVSLLPQTKVVVIPESGHFALMEKAADVHSHICDFMASLL